MPTIIFGRSELARILAMPIATINSNINRDLVPTLIGDRKRPGLTAFDAWMAAIADMFCRQGGLDRSVVSRAMFNTMDVFLYYARRVDKGEENLAAFLALRVDGKLGCFAGPFETALKRILAVRPHAIRICFVSLNIAAEAVRLNAKEHGIEFGNKFGMTNDEFAELYSGAGATAPLRRANRRRDSGRPSLPLTRWWR